MMEGGVQRGRWRRKTLVGTFLLPCLFIPSLALLKPLEEVTCDHGDYLTDSGICCNKCSPGFKLIEDCRGMNQRSTCKPCPPGQYTDQMNYFRNCKSCKRCKSSYHEVEESGCESTRNTICRCEKGYYRYKIDSETTECHQCKKCKPGEMETRECTHETNTVCKCRENYYRVNNGCEPCKNCTTDCEHHCSSLPPKGEDIKAPHFGEEYVINIVCGVVAVVLVVAVITHMVTKWSTKKKLLESPSQKAAASPESCEEVLIHSEEASVSVKAAPPSSVREHEQPSNLPDCVPFEIKIHDMIYTVLDLVPVMQMKQLVRCLGVKEREIEQAEVDHRPCREAHYQMLRVWAERGSRAGGMLHWPLLQELLEQLKKMNLEWVAEELETKYGIQ
ncbi:tumor necrosis factor receptor superfamily member 1A isoform X2 [Brachionichthys hirsutus]|uniref:tumor necrosis factor receptor superfamily member 1A isoform X2 n=1 Tax=Brachionichthys hirsutus TaxID=412623 RepID=UPI003604693F